MFILCVELFGQLRSCSRIYIGSLKWCTKPSCTWITRCYDDQKPTNDSAEPANYYHMGDKDKRVELKIHDIVSKERVITRTPDREHSLIYCDSYFARVWTVGPQVQVNRGDVGRMESCSRAMFPQPHTSAIGERLNRAFDSLF